MQLIRSKFDMTNLRTYVALTATIAFIAIGQSMNAQDDLDDLLADLEGESPAAETAAPVQPRSRSRASSKQVHRLKCFIMIAPFRFCHFYDSRKWEKIQPLFFYFTNDYIFTQEYEYAVAFKSLSPQMNFWIICGCTRVAEKSSRQR